MLALACAAAAFVSSGPVAGVIAAALAVILGLILWTPLRQWLGFPDSRGPTLVPDEHRTELRSAVHEAVRELEHPATVLWPVDNPRLKAAAAAHFPELTASVHAYSAAARRLNAAHKALTARISAECEARGITGSQRSLRVHAAMYSPLLAVAERRMPLEDAAQSQNGGGLPDLTLEDAAAWTEVSEIRSAYDAEQAAKRPALERARHDATREIFHATAACPTCALNMGRRDA